MTKALRQKIVTLVRGEEGVALVVTLALFMFLYISCAGVYTVGKAVKERIILQNAVDAAAYSAAVVQADYLSRIATINKAMAWTYNELVCCQMNWIAYQFISKSDGDYKKDAITAEWIGTDDTTESLAIRLAKGGIMDRPNEGAFAGWLGVNELEFWKQQIKRYQGQLEEMSKAVSALRDNLKTDARSAAENVLRANLPECRLGELTRYKVLINEPKDKWLVEMDADAEDIFVQFAGASNANYDESNWFELQRSGSSFLRQYKGLESHWKFIPKGGGAYKYNAVDARDSGSDLPEAFADVFARPFILNENYFAHKDKDGNDQPAAGAITVAIAKKNENPWLGLVGDLTGFYSAFGHADKNDWTFAIASAQAGYRSNPDNSNPDNNKEPRAYSLDGEAFIGTANNLSITDWDAVYVPVRNVAFPEDGAAFTIWFTQNTRNDEWEKLVADADKKYINEPLEGIRFYDLNDEALPRMHNNVGANKTLKWNGDGIHDFLDLMYH